MESAWPLLPSALPTSTVPLGAVGDVGSVVPLGPVLVVGLLELLLVLPLSSPPGVEAGVEVEGSEEGSEEMVVVLVGPETMAGPGSVTGTLGVLVLSWVGDRR